MRREQKITENENEENSLTEAEAYIIDEEFDLDAEINADECRDSRNRDYIKDMLTVYANQPVYTEQEEIYAFTALQRDENDEVIKDDVYRDITMHYMRLVIKIAIKFEKIIANSNIEDLVQDGMIGLMKAISRFHLDKGVRFSTYAVWWINQSIDGEYSNRGRSVRVPKNYIAAAIRFKKAEQELANELGREPSISEIANDLNMSIKVAERLYNFRAIPYSLDKKMEKYNNQQQFGKEVTLVDMIPDQNVNLIEHVLKKEMEKEVGCLVDTLPYNEQFVIKYKYGFSGVSLTDREIADEMGITISQVRAILKKATTKMYKSAKERNLDDYFK